MRSALLTFVLAGLVSGQLQGLPTCAQDCVTKFTSGTSIGGCPQLQAACICAQKTFISDIACCLASACNAADQQTAVNFAVQFCATQGVTVPSAVSCSTGLASTTATGGATTGSGTSTAVVVTTGASNSTTTATTAATSGATTTTAAPSSSSSASTNLGLRKDVGSGTTGVLGGLLAALALL